ncbi:20S proteasome, regulatory subunit alpha type PSMA2/PRE8 [Pseudoloma neurophilia]|uniref:20S proteasome, regulatory subunit alpha type PSMA2/PRE8 n=1 Tax=Pseudoloma neurophilia TaxID=146866 RepID=A0A0R0LUS4_9MICR|nr:20S proteasome, regulatory subunit alpha type PSMA2/PRE8 [Pseudoloma neurophilia]
MQFNDTYPTTVFSSDGTLQACDRALTAGLKGALSLGINSQNGAVISTVKINNRMIDSSKTYKITKLNQNIGLVYSGLQPDYRVLCNYIHKMIEGYESKFENMYVDTFVDRLSRILQEFTIKESTRPLGLLLLVAGRTHNNLSKLYTLDPSGSYQEIKCGAIGRDYSDALKYLERRQESLEDNMTTAVSCLKEYAGAEKASLVEVAIVDQQGFRILDSEEVREVYENIQ